MVIDEEPLEVRLDVDAQGLLGVDERGRGAPALLGRPAPDPSQAVGVGDGRDEATRHPLPTDAAARRALRAAAPSRARSSLDEASRACRAPPSPELDAPSDDSQKGPEPPDRNIGHLLEPAPAGVLC